MSVGVRTASPATAAATGFVQVGVPCQTRSAELKRGNFTPSMSHKAIIGSRTKKEQNCRGRCVRTSGTGSQLEEVEDADVHRGEVAPRVGSMRPTRDGGTAHFDLDQIAPGRRALRGRMLHQHLVIVIGSHGDREAIPVVCRSYEIFEKARQVLAAKAGVGAEVWRGAEQLYILGQGGDVTA